jgi:hypothetical protein
MGWVEPESPRRMIPVLKTSFIVPRRIKAWTPPFPKACLKISQSEGLGMRLVLRSEKRRVSAFQIAHTSLLLFRYIHHGAIERLRLPPSQETAKAV